MIKKTFICLMFVFTCFTCGCNSIIRNEIYNKAYNVSISVSDLEEAISIASLKAKPAVLGVTNYQKNRIGIFERKAIGSGVIYKASALMKDNTIIEDVSITINSNDVKVYQYYLVTNYHVIKNSDKVSIYDGDSDVEIEAAVIGSDDKADLAVIFFEYEKYIQPLDFIDSSSVKVGNFIIAIGNPFGYEYYGTTTFGIISSTRRYIKEDTDNDGIDDYYATYLQHDASINEGNSGGPIVNLEGKIVGINTLKIQDDKADGMGFAIPSNTVVEIIKKIANGSMPERVKLNITGKDIRSMTKEDILLYNIPDTIKDGFFITEVNEGYAKEFGIKANDIIVKINDLEVKYAYEISALLNNYIVGSGSSINLVVYRDGEYLTKTIIF